MKHYFRCLAGIATVLMLSLLMGCSHHNAEEEENGAHVDAAQQVGNALLERHVFVIMMQSAVEYLGYCP